jgi:O-antigen biosynthesis protein
VIFCAADVASNSIIDKMLSVKRSDIEYKIAPQESTFIIGSNSINDQGKLYFVDLNAIQSPANRRNKRLFDFMSSIAMLILMPVMIFMVDDKGGFLSNWWYVLTGKLTWVSFKQSANYNLKNYKKGILSPGDAVNIQHLDNTTVDRLNMLYSREYSIYTDASILAKNLKKLGRKV